MKNLPTSPQNRPASPERGIDRLFAELHAMYGKHWLDLWDGSDMGAVKASWATALHGLDGECIRLAINSLRTAGKTFPPTQPEFVSLCRQFIRKAPHRLRLEPPRTPAPVDIFANLKRQLAER